MFSKSADVFPFAKNLAQNALENIFQKSVDPALRRSVGVCIDPTYAISNLLIAGSVDSPGSSTNNRMHYNATLQKRHDGSTKIHEFALQ